MLSGSSYANCMDEVFVSAGKWMDCVMWVDALGREREVNAHLL